MTTDVKDRTVNGVNVTALMDTITAVKSEPAIADFTFKLENEWQGGDENRSIIREFHGACAVQHHEQGPFELKNAEPPLLLGGGLAPNPVEFILHALAGCMTTTMVYHAAARGLKVRSVRSELEGDLDLHGFLGLDENVRKGYKVIRVAMHVRSDADADTLLALAKNSPVYDIVSNSVPVEVELTVE